MNHGTYVLFQERSLFISMIRAAFGLGPEVPLAVQLEVGGVSQRQTTPTKTERSGSIVTYENVDEALVREAQGSGFATTATWLSKVKEILTAVKLTNRHGETCSVRKLHLHVRMWYYM